MAERAVRKRGGARARVDHQPVRVLLGRRGRWEGDPLLPEAEEEAARPRREGDVGAGLRVEAGLRGHHEQYSAK